MQLSHAITVPKYFGVKGIGIKMTFFGPAGGYCGFLFIFLVVVRKGYLEIWPYSLNDIFSFSYHK